MLSPPAMIRNMFGACYCIDDNTSSTDIASTTDDTNSTKSEEKLSDISRNKAVRQHFEKVYQNSNHELQEGEDGSKELQELLKKSKPLTDDERKQLYLEKLKWVSMKHM